jgi:hypothetical protein
VTLQLVIDDSCSNVFIRVWNVIICHLPYLFILKYGYREGRNSDDFVVVRDLFYGILLHVWWRGVYIKSTARFELKMMQMLHAT